MTKRGNYWLRRRAFNKYREVLRALDTHQYYVVDKYVFYKDPAGFIHQWEKIQDESLVV